MTPNDLHRTSIRLPTYDYAQAGAYFVTICAANRICMFGNIADGAVVLTPVGAIVREEWERTAILRPDVRLDAYVIMPNHFHGIVFLTGDHGREVGHAQRAPTDVAADEGHAQRAPTSDAAEEGTAGQDGHARRAPTDVAVGGGGHARRAPTDTGAAQTTPRRFGTMDAGSIAAIVGGFKAAVTSRVRQAQANPTLTIWQRNYYEHVVRNEEDLTTLQKYVAQNPLRWELDQLQPDHPSKW